MMYCDDCELILAWAENRPKFDTSFVESLQAWEGEFTDNQQGALDNIIEKHHIRKWELNQRRIYGRKNEQNERSFV